ncbi:Cation/H(+) antiporter 28 [Apostasia shenzhenica]|uniref:Cation/H(+) antiporter 28 n=1 Tax=Apostasia shenzhenica TaxID=1088818 RepID=A0A2I0B0M5_9ASPA|nr:Cation/H(+) antiporter 28 [Apostasia shenzhenica]
MRISNYAFAFYLFVLGLEMEPRSILQWSGPANKIAYAGIISTVCITLLCYSFINYSGIGIALDHSFQVMFGLAVGLAATSSPILTRLITELKIGKSEIGRLAVRCGLANDMICTSLMCVGIIFCGSFYSKNGGGGQASAIIHSIVSVLLISFEVWVVLKIVNPIFSVLNDRNPQGKPIRGIDMAVVSVLSVLLCSVSSFFGFDQNFNAFVVGLFLPRDGRMSNFLISKINFALTAFILPLYLVMVGINANYDSWMADHEQIRTVYKLLIIGSIGVVGKLTGTVAYSIGHGLRWPEAVALGLLLNVKGYFHIFCAYAAMNNDIIDRNSMMVMMLVIIGTVVPTPLVVAFIVRRARARGQGSLMGLQWHDPSRELRVLVGLHGVEDVPIAVNVMETMRAAEGSGDGGGLVTYVVDMVEMTDKAMASLVHGEGMEAVTVTDEGIMAVREQVRSALEAYKAESGDGVRVRCLLAVAAFDDMHEDICSSAQDCMVLLVVLPFHRRNRVDGAMDIGHLGYRMVNERVLQEAPCSVGIFVDRGLGGSGQSSMSSVTQNVCVVFIGGADDREALAYAGRMADHPGVRMMVLRFLPDSTAKGKESGPGRRVLAAVGRQEMEMKADDEYFTEFYDRFIASGGAGYMEKHVGSGAETVATLRALEGQYQLFIVGRGKDRDSVLTAGMSEWAECPEIGPIGDILASSDFSATASVLVIQQHNISQSLNVIDDEFLPI